jgi:hypothetical protein
VIPAFVCITFEGMALLQKISHLHLAMMDELIADPTIRTRDLATKFGLTEKWTGEVINDELFLTRLAERRLEFLSEKTVTKLDEMTEALTEMGLLAAKHIKERITAGKANEQLLIRACDISSRLSLGAVKTKKRQDPQNSELSNHIYQLAENLKAVMPKEPSPEPATADSPLEEKRTVQ